MRHLSAAACVLVCVTTACVGQSGRPGDYCRVDDDCGQRLVCLLHACHAPPASGGGLDASPLRDAGAADASAVDAATDAGTSDASAPDVGLEDAAADAGAPDAAADAPDAAAPDGGAPDAATDAGATDAGSDVGPPDSA